MHVRLATSYDIRQAGKVLSAALRPIPWHLMIYRKVPAAEHESYHAAKIERFIQRQSGRVYVAADLTGEILGVLICERIGFDEDKDEELPPLERPQRADLKCIADFHAKASAWKHLQKQPHLRT